MIKKIFLQHSRQEVSASEAASLDSLYFSSFTSYCQEDMQLVAVK